MADIELAIRVSEEIYNHTQEYEVGGFNQENDTKIFMAIKNGQLLPKECDIQRFIPKRVDIKKWIIKCPNPKCNHVFSTHHGDEHYIIEHKPDFCPNCGQALLWESEVSIWR